MKWPIETDDFPIGLKWKFLMGTDLFKWNHYRCYPLVIDDFLHLFHGFSSSLCEKSPDGSQLTW